MNLAVLFIHTIWKGLDRHVSQELALRYIAEHFQQSRKRHPRSIYSLKHDFEGDCDRYICEEDYANCLRQCGLKVVDGRVYAKEV